MVRRRWLANALGSSVVIVIAGACGNEPDAPVQCSRVVWHRAATPAAYVEIVGDFNDWKRPGVVMNKVRADGYRGVELSLSPGEHTYAVVEDGVWLLDDSVGTSAYHEAKEVTWVDVPDCALPSVHVESATMTGGEGQIRASTLAGVGGAAIESIEIESTEGNVDVTTAFDGKTITATLPRPPRGRSRFTVRAIDERGHASVPVIASLWNEPEPFDPRDALVYQVIVDRYRDERGPLSPPRSASGWAGGTLDGVRRSIEAGEIEKLGANVIWLSPLYRNPTGEFPGAPGRVYTGYHGYWPVAPREVDPRLGTADDLRALVASAHRRGIRILFDVVPNHVHAEHPYASAAAHPGWVNGVAGQCTCGAPSCDWGAHTLDCWFAPYLPDLDWTNGDLARQETDDVRFWVDTFGADGVRIDAVPMTPRSSSRRIAYALRSRFEHPGNKIWMVGENFTGEGGLELLKPELGPVGLDTEFHFPLMWTLRRVIASGSGAMSEIDDVVVKTDQVLAGAGATMGLMVGNHDVARFATVAAGDTSSDGWTNAPFSEAPEVYAKQLLALGLVETLPGAPFLYFGDEIALPGRGDPDTRRVMPGLDTVRPEALAVREAIAKIGRARRCSRALRRGTYQPLHADRDVLVFARVLDGEAALVVAVRHPMPEAGSLAIPLPGVPAGSYVDVVSGAALEVDPALTTLPTGSFSVGVYLTPKSKCVSPSSP